MAGLKLEIAQERPFSSLEEEALLNLLRTADCINRAFHLQVRTWGVTSTQYNVLRILRGAHPAALTCSEIGLRMIATDPDITRLLGRLKALKLIRQNRDRHDRRMVLTRISDAGLELLKQMDPLVQRLPMEMLGNLSKDELAELVRLLELGRRFSLDSARTCSPDGRQEDRSSSHQAVSCNGTKA
jgi:DNA-binding MarR family transcriptional regulator